MQPTQFPRDGKRFSIKAKKRLLDMGLTVDGLAKKIERPRSTVSTAIPGTKISTGTSGCTRDSASSRRDSNIGGEARSTSVRLADPSFMSSAQPTQRS